ncbi:hypothetical protein V2J09_002733 [Rumex salicifolius]
MTFLKSKGFLPFHLLHIMSLLSLVDSSCTPERKYDNTIMETRFKSWLERNNKHYESRYEWMLRFGIYQANLNFIDYINSQNLTYKLGDNEFADLTNEEFKALYVGRLIFPPTAGNHSQNSTAHETLQQAPLAIDWRKKGAVNPIKNQGPSCDYDFIIFILRVQFLVWYIYTFLTTSAVESIIKIKKGKLVSLSEQELIDCDTEAYDNGCSGGYKDGAFQYIQQNGLSTEAEYPYTATQGECKAPVKKTATISGFKTVAANSEGSLLTAVAQQPVSVSVESSGSEFKLYSSGIFQGKCGTKLDHDLIIVGYGEEKGVKYWIIRNSWGKNWGEVGYMRVLRGAAQSHGLCGLAMSPSYPLA